MPTSDWVTAILTGYNFLSWGGKGIY